MDKTAFAKFARGVKLALAKHGPEILTGIGISGMVTTTILAVRATPKALELIKEAEEERDERGRRRAALPVEAERDDRSGRAPDGSRDREEHEDVVDLAEVEAEGEGEERHAHDGHPQVADLAGGGPGFLPQRKQEVLHDRARPGVQIGRVGGQHQEDGHGEEQADET